MELKGKLIEWWHKRSNSKIGEIVNGKSIGEGESGRIVKPIVIIEEALL